jgi:hypothetical protein
VEYLSCSSINDDSAEFGGEELELHFNITSPAQHSNQFPLHNLLKPPIILYQKWRPNALKRSRLPQPPNHHTGSSPASQTVCLSLPSPQLSNLSHSSKNLQASSPPPTRRRPSHRLNHRESHLHLRLVAFHQHHKTRARLPIPHRIPCRRADHPGKWHQQAYATEGHKIH